MGNQKMKELPNGQSGPISPVVDIVAFRLDAL